MLKLPVSSLKINFNNEQFREEYERLLNESNINEVYFEKTDCGLREISSNLYFYRTITFDRPAKLVYICSSLNFYFIPTNDLTEVKARRAMFIKTFEDRVKYMEFFNNCKELVLEDRTLAEKNHKQLARKMQK